MESLKYLAPIAALIGLIVALLLANWVKSRPEGADRMKEVSGFIRTGAMAFLKREYKYMAVVIAVLVVVLGFAISWISALLYLIGALFSVLAGYFGMNVATWGNVRTANAANEHGMPAALKVAFRSGAVMGLCVAGLGLLGLGVVFIVLGIDKADVITGFGLGASSMALCGRGGG
ncbi:MAG: sodium/proton-translocating pyrophosphatase, partial [Clostridiales Family XIII bacterium]|nr:sodium/proton-translocating pyrophosphatase [Clostridiales Family XIII bacterium]